MRGDGKRERTDRQTDSQKGVKEPSRGRYECWSSLKA